MFPEKNFHDFNVQNSSNSDDRADDDFPIMIEKIPLGGNNGPRGTC